MTTNAALFPAPIPALPAVTTDTDDLEAAEAVAQTRVTGSAAARNLKYDVVLRDVRDLMAYVQKLADATLDEEEAIALIQAAGFDVKSHGVRVKPDLQVKQGLASGQVHLLAKALPRTEGRGIYEWQKSQDANVWVPLPTTLGGRAVVNALDPDSKWYFRVRIVTANGAKTWSSVVSIIVE